MESEQVTPVDSIKDVVRSYVKISEFDKHLPLSRCWGAVAYRRNVVEITIKMKTIIWKPLMIKIIKLRLRNLELPKNSQPDVDSSAAWYEMYKCVATHKAASIREKIYERNRLKTYVRLENNQLIMSAKSKDKTPKYGVRYLTATQSCP